jgi:hypothetical protein
VTAWKAGHRECCRKLGEFKARDYVKLTGIMTEPQKNGQLVEITKARKIQEGHEKSESREERNRFGLLQKKMVQMRPLK